MRNWWNPVYNFESLLNQSSWTILFHTYESKRFHFLLCPISVRLELSAGYLIQLYLNRRVHYCQNNAWWYQTVLSTVICIYENAERDFPISIHVFGGFIHEQIRNWNKWISVVAFQRNLTNRCDYVFAISGLKFQLWVLNNPSE